MDFAEAVNALKQGNKVRRRSWGLEYWAYYLDNDRNATKPAQLRDGWGGYAPFLGMYNERRKSFQSWAPTEGDMMRADDWEVVD